ncbi:MAG: lysophospholipid acyltransferase family protein [Stagnimonas sp.]|nr:lysophospholipid acyltransferase family protein [Stagnimonas sp.]
MSLVIGPRLPRRGNAFSRWFGRAFLRLLGWRIEGEIPDLPKMVLIGAPHTTNMDGVIGLATLTALGLQAGTMIKDSAFKGPMGVLLRWFGAIPIDRKSPKGVVEQSVDAFRNNERLLLLIAPEGTRHSAPELKRGYYHIALGAGVPVLPAAADYKHKLVTFGPAVLPSGDYAADLAKLMQFYSGHGWPKHPQRLSKPFCELHGLRWNGRNRR